MALNISAARWEQHEQALATAWEHMMFHSKTQRLTSCVLLSTLRWLLQVICKLGPACRHKEETQVSGSTYQRTHPPGMGSALQNSQQSISWVLDTSCHRTLSASPKCSCRELPRQTLEKNGARSCDLCIRVVLQTSGGIWPLPEVFIASKWTNNRMFASHTDLLFH